MGYEGVDKRIDVLATAIHAGLTGPQLERDLDLASRAPYSSAKDPVNMAGFMIENLSHGWWSSSSRRMWTPCPGTAV